MLGSSVIIEHLSKDYGDFHALKDVSMNINQGEFFSILGPSGCGKTTLLRIIAGFVFPDEGAVYLGDQNIVDLPPEKRDCNTVFQNYALFPHLSIYENIAFPLRLQKMSESAIDERVKKYLKMVQLEGHSQKKPTQVSGGQRQRVAIARALINEPKVLLLDEPLSALDAKLRSNLLIDLDNIHDQIGITFIYITHDQSEALSVSDRIAVMNKGEILQIGEPFEIYESPATEFVASFIGETNIFSTTVSECSKKEDTDEYLCKLELDNFSVPVFVTDDGPTKVGQRVSYTVRPEKIHISLQKPMGRKYLNIFKGIVEEPIYAGFQSKLYIRLENGELIKVFKQHIKFLDEGPEISYLDEVYVSWTAADGYIIEDIDR
ncbi:MAG: ABC transporter ATP-binding protein [Sphaerochaeta sp.]